MNALKSALSLSLSSSLCIVLLSAPLSTPLLASSSSPLPPIQIVNPPYAIDRAAWAANATYHVNRNGRIDHLLALRTATKAFEQNPQVDPFEVIRSLNRLESDFGERFQLARGTGAAGADSAKLLSDYLSTAASLISLGSGGMSSLLSGAVAASASAVSSVGATLYESTFGPQFRLPEQLRLARAYESLGNDQLEEWLASWDRAAADPRFALVIDTFFGPQFHASTSDRFEAIHSKNPDYADHEMIRELLELSRNAQMDRAGIQELLLHTQSKYGELLSELRIRSTQSTSSPTDRQRDQDQLRAEVLRAGWNHITAILSSFDPRSARTLARAGDAIFRVADAINKFSDTTARFGQLGTGVGTAIATGNVISATLALTQLLGEGPTTDEIILEQLRDIRTEMAALSEAMHDRFDRIDRALHAIYDGMNERMTRLEVILEKNLNNQIVDLQASLLETQRHLHEIETRLNRIETRLAQQTELQQEVDLHRDWNQCQRDLADPSKSSFRTFKNCLESLEIQPARPILSAGRSYSDSQLAAELSAPLSRKIPYLLSYASGWAGLRPLNDTATLPDLNDWATRAIGFASLYESYPDYWKVSGGAQLERYLDLGAAFSRSMKNSLIVAGEAGPEPDETLLSTIAENYRSKLRLFAHALRTARKEFEQAHASGHSLTESRTPKWSGPQFITACTSPSPDRRLEFEKLAFPKALLKTIPASAQLMEDLEPGRMRLCFELARVDSKVHFENSRALHGEICRGVDPGFPDDYRHLPECVRRDQVTSTVLEVRIRGDYRNLEDPANWPVLATARSSRVQALITPQKCHYQLKRCHTDGEVIDALDDLNWRIQTLWKGAVNATAQSKALSLADAPASWDVEASGDLERHFGTLRSDFHEYLKPKLSGDLDLKRSLQALSGAKRLLEGHLFMALPRTFESDDTFRSWFHGSDGLLDEPLVTWISHKNPELLLGDPILLGDDRLSALLNRTREALSLKGGKEEHPLVTEVLDQLTALKKERLERLPKKPIDEVLQEIRLKIGDLQAK